MVYGPSPILKLNDGLEQGYLYKKRSVTQGINFINPSPRAQLSSEEPPDIHFMLSIKSVSRHHRIKGIT